MPAGAPIWIFSAIPWIKFFILASWMLLTTHNDYSWRQNLNYPNAPSLRLAGRQCCYSVLGIYSLPWIELFFSCSGRATCRLCPTSCQEALRPSAAKAKWLANWQHSCQELVSVGFVCSHRKSGSPRKELQRLFSLSKEKCSPYPETQGGDSACMKVVKKSLWWIFLFPDLHD